MLKKIPNNSHDTAPLLSHGCPIYIPYHHHLAHCLIPATLTPLIITSDTLAIDYTVQ